MWVEWEEYITSLDVLIHDGVGIGGAGYHLDYNPVSFKRGVSFVCWQPERICVCRPLHGITHGDLLVVPEGHAVGPGHFSKF